MAEVVHRNLEAMVPQLEELETSGIFTHEEIRTVIKFRRHHEYRMVRRPAHKEDFLAAIQYELHLDLLRRHRKKRLRITGTRSDADYGIGNRIHGLFRRALKKFKGDLKLWLQYIEFARTSNHTLSLGRIYGRALAIHPSATALWVMAAKFQFETMKDVSSARSLFQQGLRANTSSQQLWLEYFRMELMHTDKVRKRREVLGLQEEGVAEEAGSDDFLSYKAASVVFKQAIKAVPKDVEFRLSFLPVYRLFSGTESLQEEVYESLREDFPRSPAVWDVLARRPWVGVASSDLEAAEVAELERASEELFEEGLSALRSPCAEKGAEPAAERGVEPAADDIAALWGHYLTWAVERLEDVSSHKSCRKMAVQRVVSTFQDACNCGEMSVQAYLEYVKVLRSLGRHKEVQQALCSALRTHPSSPELWLVRLDAEKGAGLEQLCREALEQVSGKDSLPLWQHWLGRVVDCPSQGQHQQEQVFKLAVSCGCKEVAEPIGVLYLEWGFKVGGLPKARCIYKELMATPPVAYSLYEKCLELEGRGMAAGVKGGLKMLRNLYEKAIRDYGNTHIDLWLKYISLELHASGGDVGKVGTLHWRAMKTLDPSLCSGFLEQYSQLHTHNSPPASSPVLTIPQTH